MSSPSHALRLSSAALLLLAPLGGPAPAQVATPGGGASPGLDALGQGNRAGACAPDVVVEFDDLGDGQPLGGQELADVLTLSAWGPNAGLAIFDSTVGGPNDGGPDPQLIVGKGNLLILQDDASAALSAPLAYAVPNDDLDGGTVRFAFAAPSRPLSIDLIAAGAGGGGVLVSLIDALGKLRYYDVPPGYAAGVDAPGEPGFVTLHLQTLAPQHGYAAEAIAAEDEGFDAGSVVALEIWCTGSLGLDRLVIGTSTGHLPQRAYPAKAPFDLAVADVNGDGDVDLLVPDSDADAVLVHLNDGQGTFPPAVAYATAVRPMGISVVDLDGDGARDLAVACLFLTGALESKGAVSILLNLADGSFGPQAEYVLPKQAESVATADFDGDGDIDVAAGHGSGFDIYVLPNQGDGTLGMPAILPTGGDPFHTGVLTGDFNLDGSPDLAMPMSSDEQVEVWLNQGQGTFGALTAYPSGGDSGEGTVADIDHDGDPDLVVALSDVGKSVSVLKNLGGAFAEPVTYDAGAPGETVTTLDADGDADLDLAVGAWARLTMFKNLGNGTFVPRPGYQSVNNPDALAGGDLDGDGDVDLVVGENTAQGSGANVFRNRGDGTFHARKDFACGDGPEDLCLADVDGDGDLDAATADTSGDTVSVLLGHGDGKLAASVAYAVGNVPRALASADLDGDGAPDLAAACDLDDAVSVLLNQGGAFVPPAVYASGNSPSSLTAGDWNNDGHIDLAVAFGNAAFGPPDGVGLYTNAGDGSFLLPTTVALDPSSIDHGDFDLDGDLDLAVTTWSDTSSVLYNQGGGTFVQGAALPGGDNPASLRAADWSGDGALDLAYCTSEGTEVRLNLGDGSFGLPAVYGAGPLLVGIDAGDRDGDGDLELLVGNEEVDSLLIFDNQGDGTFGAHEGYATGPGTGGPVAADLNGDGKLDLLAAARVLDAVSVLLTECD
jgi:hypothetical protein